VMLGESPRCFGGPQWLHLRHENYKRTAHPSTWHHVPADLNPQLKYCEDFKSHTTYHNVHNRTQDKTVTIANLSDAIDERSRGVSNRMDLTANTHTHIFCLCRTVSYRLITKNYRNKATLWKLLKKASNRFVLDCMHFYTLYHSFGIYGGDYNCYNR